MNHISFKNALLGLFVAGAGMMASLAPVAATVTGNTPVTATVQANCSFVLGTGTAAVDLPTNNSSLTSNWTSNSIQVAANCTKGAVVALSMDQGSNANTGSTCDTPLRRMKSPAGNYVNYSLYKPNSQPNLGCGTNNTYSFTSASAATAYYQVPTIATSGQDVPAGAYSDTVLATLSF